MRKKYAPGTYGQLFRDFLKFGCFTFGGGWSIVAQMQELYVEQRKTITAGELLDLTSVSRSIPGAMVANIAMLYGCRTAGLPGGFIATLGLSLPPLAILSVLTFCYTAVKEAPLVMAAMTGVRASVVPIILAALLGMVKGSVPVAPCWLAAGLTFVLYLFFDVSCVWLVVLGAVLGLVISGFLPEKGGEKR